MATISRVKSVLTRQGAWLILLLLLLVPLNIGAVIVEPDNSINNNNNNNSTASTIESSSTEQTNNTVMIDQWPDQVPVSQQNAQQESNETKPKNETISSIALDDQQQTQQQTQVSNHHHNNNQTDNSSSTEVVAAEVAAAEIEQINRPSELVNLTQMIKQDTIESWSTNETTSEATTTTQTTQTTATTTERNEAIQNSTDQTPPQAEPEIVVGKALLHEIHHQHQRQQPELVESEQIAQSSNASKSDEMTRSEVTLPLQNQGDKETVKRKTEESILSQNETTSNVQEIQVNAEPTESTPVPVPYEVPATPKPSIESNNNLTNSIKFSEVIRSRHKLIHRHRHYYHHDDHNGSSNGTDRRFQLVEIRPGLHLLESHEDSREKTLRIVNLFGDRQNRSIDIVLRRIDSSQWRDAFRESAQFLITRTDRMAMFKVSFESVLRAKPVHGHPNLNYHRLLSADHTNLYVNDRNRSVLLITRLGEYVEIYGLISDQLIITPIWRRQSAAGSAAGSGQLPRSFSASLPHPQREQLNHFYADESKRTLLHAVIDNRDSIAKHMGFDIGQLLEQIRAKIETARAKQRRTEQYQENISATDTIYPEISLLIDYWAYEAHGRNLDELWRYMVIYYTRIDLVFRQLTAPSVRMRLSDIYIATQPFRFQRNPPRLSGDLSRRKSNQTGPPYLNALKAINELGVMLYRESPTFSIGADLILVITGTDLCLDHQDSGWASSASPYDTCSYRSIKGQSFVGGACKIDAARHKRLNVAIVEDGGYFDGVLVAAHELGHLIGAVHDGQWPITGILGPGGRGCASNRGYLMSISARRAFVPTYNQFKWSLCSAEQFRYFAHLPQSVCLYNRPAF